MRITQYTPEPGHLAHRVCSYLQRFPFVPMSVLGIAKTFAVPAWDVRHALAQACDWGLLQREGHGAETVYTAGPHLLDTPLEGVPLPGHTQARPAKESTQ